MDFIKELNDILNAQQEQLINLKSEIKKLEETDFINNNLALEEKIKDYENDLNELYTKTNELKKENMQLKEALMEEAYKQKLTILNVFGNRIYLLYKNFESIEHNNLRSIEQNTKANINQLRQAIESNMMQSNSEIQMKLQELNFLLNNEIQKHRNAIENASKDFQSQSMREIQKLSTPPTPEQVAKRAQNNNTELKFGGRITNILGVVLILLGVIFGLQYTYVNFLTSDALKSAMAFLIGVSFLIGGEVLNRKSRSAFSLGITAGGVAILFASTTISYFVLNVLSVPAAFCICVLVAVLAFILSLRYESQTIANFALVGGFLPIYAISLFDNVVLLTVMLYLFILSIFAMALSARKEWSAVKYISFGLNSLSMISCLGASFYMENIPVVLIFLYVMANFLVYVFVALIYPMRKSKPVSAGSFLMLTINTLLNCLLIFWIMAVENLNQYYGVVALFIAVFYMSAGRFFDDRVQNKGISALFWGTAFTFCVLVIPLQFDAEWISLGWLFEAIILIVIGILSSNKWQVRAGTFIFILCFLTFLFADFLGLHDIFYIGKATAIIAGIVIIFCTLLYKNRNTPQFMYLINGKTSRYYKNFTFVSVYVYALILAEYFLRDGFFNQNFYIAIIFISVIYTFVLNIFKQFKDDFIIDLQTMLYIGAIFICLILNFSYNSNYSKLESILMIGYNVASIIAVWNVFSIFLNKKFLTREIQTLCTSIFLIFIILQILLCQYNYDFNSMLISFILVVSAFILILHGFNKHYPYIRRFGLFLEITSIVKFFLLDLFFLNQGQRIISYFVLGAVLIGISFLYQYFSKKLEKGGVSLEK